MIDPKAEVVRTTPVGEWTVISAQGLKGRWVQVEKRWDDIRAIVAEGVPTRSSLLEIDVRHVDVVAALEAGRLKPKPVYEVFVRRGFVERWKERDAIARELIRFLGTSLHTATTLADDLLSLPSDWVSARLVREDLLPPTGPAGFGQGNVRWSVIQDLAQT